MSITNNLKLVMAKKSTTLVEVMIVAGIMTIVLGGILSFLIMSDNSWEIGQDKLAEQQQARIAMTNIADALQRSSPNWVDITGNSYGVTLNTSRIDFYIPQFYMACCPDYCGDDSLCRDGSNVLHDSEDIQALLKVTYKLDPNDSTKLLKKEGTSQEVSVANDMSRINFSCGCIGCTAVDDNCPFVDIDITTQRQTQCNLQSKINLRNQRIILVDVDVEEPEEGEF